MSLVDEAKCPRCQTKHSISYAGVLPVQQVCYECKLRAALVEFQDAEADARAWPDPAQLLEIRLRAVVQLLCERDNDLMTLRMMTKYWRWVLDELNKKATSTS